MDHVTSKNFYCESLRQFAIIVWECTWACEMRVEWMRAWLENCNVVLTYKYTENLLSFQQPPFSYLFSQSEKKTRRSLMNFESALESYSLQKSIHYFCTSLMKIDILVPSLSSSSASWHGKHRLVIWVNLLLLHKIFFFFICYSVTVAYEGLCGE